MDSVALALVSFALPFSFFFFFVSVVNLSVNYSPVFKSSIRFLSLMFLVYTICTIPSDRQLPWTHGSEGSG